MKPFSARWREAPTLTPRMSFLTLQSLPEASNRRLKRGFRGLYR